MADAVRLIQAAVVLLVVGSYTAVLMRGLNQHLGKHLSSSVQREMERNPHMRRDYEEFKEQLRQAEVLREQAKRLQEEERLLLLVDGLKKKREEEEEEKERKETLTGTRRVRRMEGPDSRNHSWGWPPSREEL